MVSVVACLVLGLVLVGAAASKLAGGAAARAALATYGLRGSVAWAGWAALIGAETALGVLVGAGLGWAAEAAALLMCGAAGAQLAALLAGRGGAPCGCFGARGRLGSASVGRAVALAAALALVPVLPRSTPSTDGWLAIGLGFALAALAALAVVVLALAREIGMLRLAVPQAGALEVAHEGPEVGARSALAAAFAPELRGARLGLAVFTSEGCGMCRALAPAIARFGEHPSVVLRTFDELAEAGAWAAADVPGSPFAVVLDGDGTVLAKGTFNTGAQLESVLATAERRRGAVRA
jgi:hypothetical protein